MYMKYSEAILGMDPGRGEEFDALYAQEGKERSEREQLRQKRFKRPNKQELKNVKRVDAKSIRDVLRKRLKGDEINSSHQRQNDISSYQSDRKNSQLRNYNYNSHRSRLLQKIKKEESKTKSFRAKLRELSMSPRTRIKEELENLSAESTQELSIEDKRNLKDFNKALIHRNKPSSSEKSKTGTESIKESPGSWLFKSAKRRKKEWLQQQLDLRRKVREQAVSPKKKKLIRHREHTTKSHQTARSIVEEDLKQRLQQMDFKLTPTKIFEARSERSKTSCDRSSDSKTHNNSSDASVRSLKRRRKLPFGQRIFDKRSYANKSKHSNKGDDRLSQGSQKDGSSKYHSQSENRRKGKKKKMKAQLRREKEWISKYSSDISTNNKAKRNSLERTNQKPTKIFPLSSSRKEKLGKNRLDEKIDCTIKNAKSDKRTVRTDTKKSSEKENLRNLRKFDQTSNANIHSKTSLSISLSGRNIMSRESKTHPNASTKPVISNKISSNYLLRKNAPQILKTKVDLSRLSNKFNISEKASVNQSFINKPKKSDVKKSNWKKGKKLSSMEENLNSSLRRSHKSNSSLSSESLKSTVKVEKKDEKSSVTSLKTANTSESSKRSKKKRSRQYSRQKDRQLIGNENAKEDVMMNHS
uniref:Bm7682, isoform b n=1 Tax=Brugia malayi TaxID=6279 RepID=A0A1I9G848_BRUMA|nr:Bm7682, isoform b [Brugia malayi]